MTGADRHPAVHDRPSLQERWAAQYGDLVRYASHLLSGDTHAAEDVAQETAIRLWQHAEVLDDDRPLGGWLRTVARNIVIDRSRRRRARPAEVTLGSDVEPECAGALDDIDAAASVATILSPLSPRLRAVVYEIYVRDRPVATVAADLGIPPGTVKSRCHTALHQLRASLSSDSS